MTIFVKYPERQPYVRSLPSTIGRLVNLVTFDMSYNMLECIPDEIGITI